MAELSRASLRASQRAERGDSLSKEEPLGKGYESGTPRRVPVKSKCEAWMSDTVERQGVNKVSAGTNLPKYSFNTKGPDG